MHSFGIAGSPSKDLIVQFDTSLLSDSPHLLVWVDELCACISAEHVDDNHLTPLLHVDKKVAQFAVVFVDQVYPLRAHFLEGLDGTACYQLKPQQQEAWLNMQGGTKSVSTNSMSTMLHPKCI